MNKNIYENFKKDIETPETIEKYQKVFKVIDADINRTEFIHSKDKGLISINYILKSLQLYNFENNYCQGINYVVSYLYQNTLNEEELLTYSFISWPASASIFAEEDKIVWNAIKAAMFRAKTLLITRQYFEKKWFLNSCN
jgi:hypothetical protein